MPLSLSASMMRWNPSVISRSASPEGFSCTAASDIVFSRGSLRRASCSRAVVRSWRSVQVVGVFRHMLGKAERMRAYQLLGAGGVTRLQRLDDVHVVVDRAVGTVLLADRLHADHPHMGEQVLSERNQHAVAAHADDGLVELDVHLGIFVEPRMELAVLELGEHGAQRGDVVVAGILGDQPRRHALERRPGGDHLDHLALGLAHHIDAAPGHRAHEAFALELRHRLAHRRAADAEVLSEAALVEAHLGALPVDIERDDDVLERRIGPALEARRAYHRLDLHCRAGAGMLRFVQVPDAGTTGTLTCTHRSCTLSAAWYAIFQTLPLCNAEFVGFLSRCSSHSSIEPP